MKKHPIIIAIAILGILSLVLHAASPEPPKTSATVSINSTENLKADQCTYFPHQLTLDPITAQFYVEKRKASGALVDRELVTLDHENVKTWVNSTNPPAALKTLLLGKCSLTEKSP